MLNNSALEIIKWNSNWDSLAPGPQHYAGDGQAERVSSLEEEEPTFQSQLCEEKLNTFLNLLKLNLHLYIENLSPNLENLVGFHNTMYLFPIVTITNYQKLSGMKQQNYSSLNLWTSEVPKQCL